MTKVVLTHHPSLERKQQGYKKDGVSRHCVVKTWLTLTWQNTQAYQEHVTGDPTKQHVKQGHEIRNRAKHPASKQERNYAKILYKTFCHIWKYNFQILRLANKELSFSKRIILFANARAKRTDKGSLDEPKYRTNSIYINIGEVPAPCHHSYAMQVHSQSGNSRTPFWPLNECMGKSRQLSF